MMTLPGRVTVATARLVALLELAEWGARSEADRLLVAEVRNDVQRLGEKYMAAQAALTGFDALPAEASSSTDRQGGQTSKGGQDAGDLGGLDGGAAGTESQGESRGDGRGQGTEPGSPGGGVV